MLLQQVHCTSAFGLRADALAYEVLDLQSLFCRGFCCGGSCNDCCTNCSCKWCNRKEHTLSLSSRPSNCSARAVALAVGTGVAKAFVINTVAMAVAWAATVCACMESSSLCNDNKSSKNRGSKCSCNGCCSTSLATDGLKIEAAKSSTITAVTQAVATAFATNFRCNSCWANCREQ